MPAQPAPTALKLLKGTRKDRINQAEPKPTPGTVTPPPMSRAARSVWNRLAPDLIAKKVLTRWDVDLFAQYCEATVVARHAYRAIDREGVIVTGRDGGLVQNPACIVAGRASTTMAQIGPQFGIGPAARSKIVMEGAPKHAKGAQEFFTP